MEGPRNRLYAAGEIATELGLTQRALRFYETKGLVSPRRVGSRRVYDYRDRARLKLVLRGKRLGFSLAEIREYLALYDVDTTQVEQLRQLDTALTRRMDDLAEQREALDRTLEELGDIRRQARAALAERGLAPPSSTSPRTSTPGDDSP